MKKGKTHEVKMAATLPPARASMGSVVVLHPFEPPDAALFCDPLEDLDTLAYCDEVCQWHGYMRFLGLPNLKENPDTPLERLFIEPDISEQYISPSANSDTWPVREPFLEALLAHPRMVLLGDPGSGKSTLANWILYNLARRRDNALREALGRLLPIPLVVRELELRDDLDWDGLMKSFRGHLVARPLEEKNVDLTAFFARGQAFFVLDGLDEIGNPKLRGALHRAVDEGFRRFPKCRWLITSRIVGYSETPLHLPPGYVEPVEVESSLLDAAEDLRRLLPAGIAAKFIKAGTPWDTARGILPALHYVSPFSDAQIEAFAEHWYAQRETLHAKVPQAARDLVARIRQGEGTLRLARIPNLLSFMALIHRVRAHLPHGRARLYNDIAQAYLESIDEFRGIKNTAYTYEMSAKWLARVGFEMQRRRGKEKPEEREREILANQDDVEGWVAEAMRATGYPCPDYRAEARSFVDFIGRRSGLLLPRGQREGIEQFAFMHLSFQEYFAARHLVGVITSPRWIQQKPPIAKGTRQDDLREYRDAASWHETLYFLFELLAAHTGWPDEVADVLFKAAEEAQDAPGADKYICDSEEGGRLLARLVIDPFNGLSENVRRKAFEASWRYHTENQWRSGVARILTTAEGALLEQSQNALLALNKAGLPHATLRLSGCTQVQDWSFLEKLTGLQLLDLSGCTQVQDGSFLERLTGLKHLYLNDCTQIQDWSFLDKLTGLEWLSLDGCTQIRHCSFLKKLTRLLSLVLIRCTQLEDWSFLEKLTGLESLYLSGCTQIQDGSFLEKLTGLKGLDLSGCTQIQDWSFIEKLAGLKWLYLGGCTQIQDWSFLEKLTGLTGLYLDGCTQIQDWLFLGKLTGLTWLDVGGCTQLSDAGFLASLPRLRAANLRGCPNVKGIPPALRKRVNVDTD